MSNLPQADRQPTKLVQARILLEDTDAEIVGLLQNFKPASAAVKTPSATYLADFMRHNPLPSGVIDLCAARNTPIALFAGVAQFLNLKDIQAKKAEFIALCDKLCDRHNHSRLVVAHKSENREDFMGDDNRVITFVDDQHDTVVKRAYDFAAPVATSMPLHQELSANVIEFCALAGAGWQDMAINYNKGPFAEKITDAQLDQVKIPSEFLARNRHQMPSQSL